MGGAYLSGCTVPVVDSFSVRDQDRRAAEEDARLQAEAEMR